MPANRNAPTPSVTRMIRFIYNLLFPLALLFFLPGYVVKMLRRGNYRNKFGQRLGFYDRETRAKLARRPCDLAACGQCRRSHDRAEARDQDEGARTVTAHCPHHHDDDRFRAGQQTGAGLDRGALHPARLLADHAPRLRTHPANPYRPRGSGGLAQPDRHRASAKNPHRSRQCAPLTALRRTFPRLQFVR